MTPRFKLAVIASKVTGSPGNLLPIRRNLVRLAARLCERVKAWDVNGQGGPRHSNLGQKRVLNFSGMPGDSLYGELVQFHPTVVDRRTGSAVHSMVVPRCQDF